MLTIEFLYSNQNIRNLIQTVPIDKFNIEHLFMYLYCMSTNGLLNFKGSYTIF